MAMSSRRWAGGLALGAVLLATSGTAQERLRPAPYPAPKAAPKFEPKFEALAETKLLMEGLAQSNYVSLAKLLKEKPADAETWTFARGQALLLAETGNLLLLRPPRNQGRDTWMREAMEMRAAAANLARQAGNRDLEQSRTALVELTRTCNHCHQTFRVPVRIGPEPAPAREGKERDVE
jgi:cytochrome c556